MWLTNRAWIMRMKSTGTRWVEDYCLSLIRKFARWRSCGVERSLKTRPLRKDDHYVHFRFVYLLGRGLNFDPKTIFIPPPLSKNDIFSPSCNTLCLDSYRALFALNFSLFCIYFTPLLPIFSVSFPLSSFFFTFFLVFL
jgi:hypothetical protein